MISQRGEIVAVVALLVPAGLPGVQGNEPSGPATVEQIAGWIEQLAAPQFARREAASRSLREAGEPAVEPLGAAILAGDLEVASRGVEILRDLLAEEPTAAAAETTLERCAEQGPGAAARLAEAVLSFHRLEAAAAARARLEALGVVIRELQAAELPAWEAEVGRGWKGSGGDLRDLARLPRLRAAAFHGVPLDEQGVAVLGRLRGLERLELFGTGLDEAAIAALAARLPDTRLDARRGGKLGVGALAFGGPCEIQTVEPGSAADQAGLRPGDEVVAIDGDPVADFEGLTARVAGRGPGDLVRLSVARRAAADGDAERLEFDVRLDAW